MKKLNKTKRKKFTGRTATAIILKEPDLLLLIKRKTRPFFGFWALPGGRLDPGEIVEETIIREVKEETGLDVCIIKKIGEYREVGIQENVEYDYSPACFLVKIIGGKIQKQEKEISSIKFFSLKNIPKKLAFEHKKMLEDYFKS